MEVNFLTLKDEEKLKQVFNKNLQGMFMILEYPNGKVDESKDEVTKIIKFIEKLDENNDDEEKTIDVNIAMKRSDTLLEGESKLLIFSCYKKEEVKNEEEEK
jgi:hypothetical protein